MFVVEADDMRFTGGVDGHDAVAGGGELEFGDGEEGTFECFGWKAEGAISGEELEDLAIVEGDEVIFIVFSKMDDGEFYDADIGERVPAGEGSALAIEAIGVAVITGDEETDLVTAIEVNDGEAVGCGRLKGEGKIADILPLAIDDIDIVAGIKDDIGVIIEDLDIGDDGAIDET